MTSPALVGIVTRTDGHHHDEKEKGRMERSKEDSKVHAPRPSEE